eukprot:9503915-Pyramimonas_sp.AAC.2
MGAWDWPLAQTQMQSRGGESKAKCQMTAAWQPDCPICKAGTVGNGSLKTGPWKRSSKATTKRGVVGGGGETGRKREPLDKPEGGWAAAPQKSPREHHGHCASALHAHFGCSGETAGCQNRSRHPDNRGGLRNCRGRRNCRTTNATKGRALQTINEGPEKR